jgi:hypothetical protein
LRLIAGLICRPDSHAMTFFVDFNSAAKYKPSAVIEIYDAPTVAMLGISRSNL